jgi:3-deoxy-D-manno-octulosonic-acid transferase
LYGCPYMIFTLYRILTDLSAWPIRAWLRMRAWRGKEEPSRLRERRGLTEMPRPAGRLVWCHAASVGESTALLPLIKMIGTLPETSVLLTTGTATSARLMAERLPEGAIHQFAPWDRRIWIARFLDHWQPDLAVRMESELWPNTLAALRDGGIATAIVSARLSDTSVRGWRRVPSVARDIFNGVSLVLAQTEEHAARYGALGAKQVMVGGNLKLAAPPLPARPRDVDALTSAVGSRPVWLAASTHAGEEETAFDVHTALRESYPGLLTIVAPRHPDRTDSILALAKSRHLTVAVRSRAELPAEDTDIYLADTLGELGVMYSCAKVVFMGKSLKAHGGQNPLEPLHFGCAIVFGPHMENFEDLAPQMVSAGMAVQIAAADQLAAAIGRLIGDAAARGNLTAASARLSDEGRRILDGTYKALTDLLDASAHHRGHDGR